MVSCFQGSHLWIINMLQSLSFLSFALNVSVFICQRRFWCGEAPHKCLSASLPDGDTATRGAADVCCRLPGHGCCLAYCLFESSAFYQSFGPVGGRVLVANARTVVILVQSDQWLQVTGSWYPEKAASGTGTPASDKLKCNHLIDLKSWTVVLG